jgi:hypothetical protein
MTPIKSFEVLSKGVDRRVNGLNKLKGYTGQMRTAMNWDHEPGRVRIIGGFEVRGRLFPGVV